MRGQNIDDSYEVQLSRQRLALESGHTHHFIMAHSTTSKLSETNEVKLDCCIWNGSFVVFLSFFVVD